MDAAAWGLIGTVVGALASIGTTWLTSKSSQRLHQERLQVERIERSRSLQRQTLLDLQEAIHDALRLVNSAHIEDRNAHSQTREWGSNLFSEEVNEGIRIAQRQVAILAERVNDDDLRSYVKELMNEATHVLLSSNEQESRFRLAKTSSDATTVLEKIGTSHVKR